MISDEQNYAEERLCQWAKELSIMGVSREDIIGQVNWALDELDIQLEEIVTLVGKYNEQHN